MTEPDPNAQTAALIAALQTAYRWLPENAPFGPSEISSGAWDDALTTFIDELSSAGFELVPSELLKGIHENQRLQKKCLIYWRRLSEIADDATYQPVMHAAAGLLEARQAVEDQD